MRLILGSQWAALSRAIPRIVCAPPRNCARTWGAPFLVRHLLPLVGMCVLMRFPVVTTGAGYRLDGVACAACGLLMPLGSPVVVWLLGTH